MHCIQGVMSPSNQTAFSCISCGASCTEQACLQPVHATQSIHVDVSTVCLLCRVHLLQMTEAGDIVRPAPPGMQTLGLLGLVAVSGSVSLMVRLGLAPAPWPALP